MTINADCNNNKLEVSVTSNGLEVTSAAAASEVAAETENTSPATLAEVGSSSSSGSGANSRSASTSPPPNTVAVVSHSRRASPPKKRTAVFINSNSGNSSAKSPAKQTTTVQRHQSMPVTATTTTSDVQQVVKAGKRQQQPLETMAPSRPSSMTANHHHQHNFNSNLPPLDNCDSIFAIVSLPATVNSRTSDAKPDAPLNTGSEGVHPSSKSPSPPLPPLVKSDRQQRKSLTTPSPPPHPPQSLPIVDWKSQLNYELTMYQQMLANQSHRSPLLRTTNTRPTSSTSSSTPKQQQQQQPSSHLSSEQHHQHHFHNNPNNHHHHHHPLNFHPLPHPRQQTPNNGGSSKPVMANGIIGKGQSIQPHSNHHHSRNSTSPVKSPTNTTTSKGSPTDLTLDDAFSWTNTAAGGGGGESRQLSPTTNTTNTSPSSITTAATNASYPSPPSNMATNSVVTSPAGRKPSSGGAVNTTTRPSSGGGGGNSRRDNEREVGVVRMATPYERLLYAMENDKTWAKEVAFGRRIGLYRFKGDIGNGNFSQVKIAIHSLTKEKVAVKILDKARLDAKTQRMLAREIRTMETLHHPNLIRIFEVIETLSKHYIVMELAPGGELFQVISLQGRLSESEGRFYFSQILSAIEHMHQHNLIHRDIKAENVFFSDPYTVKVGDFGFSTRISSQDELLSTFCGSPPYAAPELFRDESYRGPFVDYWALGVLLYFIVTGTMPFRAQTIVALKKLILDGRYDVPAYVSVECCQLIAGFLQPVPAKRYNLETAKGTRWLRGRNGTSSAALIAGNGNGNGSSSRGSVAKYDLKTSYGRLLRSRRLAAAERRNTLSEFSTAEYDFSGVVTTNGSTKTRSNRFSLVEPTSGSVPITSTTTSNRRSSPTESEKSPPPSSSSTTQPSTPATTTKILSDEERQTFRQLLTLGIDDTVIVQHLERGSISAIVGTFRIILHRAIMESALAAAAAARSERSRKEANGSRGSSSAASTATANANGNGNLGRSTSIQVAAFDRFWANYARKASAGTQGKTTAAAAAVLNSQSKQTGKKQPPLSITPGPRQATVRQMIKLQQQQQPPQSSTEPNHHNKTVVTVVDSFRRKSEEDRGSETGSSSNAGTPKDSAAATTKRNSASKFSKMMAAMVIASSKHQQQNGGSQKGTPSSASGRLANGSAKKTAIGQVMTITENGGFHPHDGNDHHHFAAGKMQSRELKQNVTAAAAAAETETPKEGSQKEQERQKVGRQKSTSSSSKDSRSNDGVTLVVENGGTAAEKPAANGHLPSMAANLQHPQHLSSSSANSNGRLSRSWRTIKSLVTDSTICGTANIAPLTNGGGPKSLPYQNGQADNHARASSPTASASHTAHSNHHSRSSTPSSSSTSKQGLPPHHHVLHKTTTLQITVPPVVVNSNSGNASTLLWSPTGNGTSSGSGKLPGSPLRRSQTTPNVSTCYRNHHLLLLNSTGSASASSSHKSKYSAANGRCTIF